MEQQASISQLCVARVVRVGGWVSVAKKMIDKQQQQQPDEI